MNRKASLHLCALSTMLFLHFGSAKANVNYGDTETQRSQIGMRKVDLVVASDGSGDVRTVQEAIDKVPANNRTRYVILIKPGIYKQQVKIPSNKPFITLLGEQDELTVLSFNLSNAQVGSTSASFSTYVGANDFRAENLTFENSVGPGSQAVALLVEADRAVFLKCRFLGWQDTLYAKAGRQFYQDCYIEGHVDFIFGAAAAVFENCTIHSKGQGYLTAHMRFSETEPTGFVFRNCRLTGKNTGKGVFLGRPWRAFGRVVFINTEMQSHIRVEGWDNWRDPAREKTAWFGEYKSRGTGANPQSRAKWSRQLNDEQVRAFDTAAFLKGNDGWKPGKSDFAWQLKTPPAFRVTSWNQCLDQRVEWYATDEATRIADNLLLYQRANGGWPKNLDMAAVLTQREKDELAKTKHLTDTTIDNGASFKQLVFLARVITPRNLERHRKAFESGFDFLLAAQYENGGFPQFYPLVPGYYSHITYNDGAMIGVLSLFRDVAEKKSNYLFVDEPRRKRAVDAVLKGIDCILKTQVRVAGRLTVWAAQHDAVTLVPAPARTFEPVALSGGESVDIIRFLMSIPNPSIDIVNAIESAVSWFEKSKITGIKWIEKGGASRSRRSDRVVVQDKKAGPLWARFYELETNRPIFAGRDGVVRYNVAEIDAERRAGYQWYVNSAEQLLKKDYPDWRRRRMTESSVR